VGGVRTISQPARATKHLQYWLMNNVFNKLNIHCAAAAYREGCSIKKNAQYHVNNTYIAKFDFRSFFPSIKGADIKAHLIRYLGDKLTENDLNDIVRISCIRLSVRSDLSLSIGAPCSPIISNSIMYEFDRRVVDWCSENNIRYTRYADDLIFSTNVQGATSNIEKYIRDIVRNLEYPSLRFNRKKTIQLSKKNRRRVTGLILINDGDVSIGRSKKREISSLIHKFTIGQLPDGEITRLQGLLGFSKGVEPKFIFRMNEKYGEDVISTIFRHRKKDKESIHREKS